MTLQKRFFGIGLPRVGVPGLGYRPSAVQATGVGVDNLLIDDNGDALLIDDSNDDILEIGNA